MLKDFSCDKERFVAVWTLINLRIGRQFIFLTRTHFFNNVAIHELIAFLGVECCFLPESLATRWATVLVQWCKVAELRLIEECACDVLHTLSLFAFPFCWWCSSSARAWCFRRRTACSVGERVWSCLFVNVLTVSIIISMVTLMLLNFGLPIPFFKVIQITICLHLDVNKSCCPIASRHIFSPSRSILAFSLFLFWNGFNRAYYWFFQFRCLLSLLLNWWFWYGFGLVLTKYLS